MSAIIADQDMVNVGDFSKQKSLQKFLSFYFLF